MAITAPSSEAARPWDVDSEDTTSATDWDVAVFPSWAREVTVQNPGTSIVYVSKGQSGTYGASDPQFRIPAGGELTIDLTAGRAKAREASQRSISLYAGASGYTLNFYVRG